MAARRLVLVLLVLLVVSTFAATLVPPPDSDEEQTTATQAATNEPTGTHVRETVSADAKRPERIRVAVGDALTLRVTSSGFREVEIPTLGEYDEVDQYAAAIFDLLLDRAGTYPIRIVDSGRVVGRIVAVSGCCRTSRKSGDTSRSR